MSYALAYWIGIFIWLVFGFYAAPGPVTPKLVGGNILLFVLLVLLGLAVFGKALHP